jgi:signal transduction histidine kinase
MNISEAPINLFGMNLGFAKDITREEELETEQKRHMTANRELLEQLGSAIAIYNADQEIEFYNSAYSQLWGLEDQWLNNRPKLADIMEKLRESRRLPEQVDFRIFKKSWLDMFTDLMTQYEEMLYLPDGTALRMLVAPHPMGGLMMSFEDVSSRLELESSYNTLIAVQKETLDNLAEGVAVYGGDGRLKLWNPSYGKLWGLHPEDLDGEPHIKKIVDKMSPYFQNSEWEKTRDMLITESLDRQIHNGRLNRDDEVLIDYSTVPLPDGGVLITHIDVSDTAKVENALREKNAALEAAERLKIDFLANVSYQLRTPLSTIMGFSEILSNEYFGPLNEKQKEYTKGMEEAGERLLNLVNDILDLSTIEAGYMKLDREAVQIADMLKGLHELTCEWARNEKVEIIIDHPKSIGKVWADERRLKQVMLNLIRNAISFTDEAGKITIKAERNDDGVTFSVSDTGSGIPEEDQHRVLEPFERVVGINITEGKGSRSGAGLGLTLVKNIVELHGGYISIDSKQNVGTTVTVFLPNISSEDKEKDISGEETAA